MVIIRLQAACLLNDFRRRPVVGVGLAQFDGREHVRSEITNKTKKKTVRFYKTYLYRYYDKLQFNPASVPYE